MTKIEIYQKAYDVLIKKARNRAKPEGYTEIHHPIPRCLGGDESKENKVALTAKEHYEAHKFLAMIYSSHQKIQYVWWSMCIQEAGNQQRYKVSAEDYAAAKAAWSKIMTDQMNDPNSKLRKSAVEGIKNRVFTEEDRKLLSESSKKLWEDPDWRQNQVDKRTGKHPTEEARKNMSEGQKGKEISQKTRDATAESNKNRVWTPEMRKNMSEAKKGTVISDKTRKKISKSQKGKKRSQETKMNISKGINKYWEEQRKKVASGEIIKQPDNKLKDEHGKYAKKAPEPPKKSKYIIKIKKHTK